MLQPNQANRQENQSMDIIQLAEQLGKAISDSPEAGALRAARKHLAEQPELAQLMQDYQSHAAKMDQLQQANKPIEVDDKHKLRELQQKLVASVTFKAFSEAQMEYVDLMRRVNQSVQQQLADTEGG